VAPNPNFARVDIEVAVPALSDVSSKCDPPASSLHRQEQTVMPWGLEDIDKRHRTVVPHSEQPAASFSCARVVTGKVTWSLSAQFHARVGHGWQPRAPKPSPRRSVTFAQAQARQEGPAGGGRCSRG